MTEFQKLSVCLCVCKCLCTHMCVRVCVSVYARHSFQWLILSFLTFTTIPTLLYLFSFRSLANPFFFFPSLLFFLSFSIQSSFFHSLDNPLSFCYLPSPSSFSLLLSCFSICSSFFLFFRYLHFPATSSNFIYCNVLTLLNKQNFKCQKNSNQK